MTRIGRWGVLLVLGLGLSETRAAGTPGDAEAVAHDDAAATLQVVAETEQTTPDFVFRQYNLAVLSHYSYLLGSGGEALIVDPARDIGRYLADAKALNLKITRVYLTHSHADFVAGHMELAKATGARIIMNAETAAGFPHQPVRDAETIVFGKVRGVVMATPGHTPDGTCLAVHAPAEAPAPAFLLTGDTLFIGSVGRPDLMGEGMSAAALAEMGFASWKNKLAKLPDETRIFPAHGAGSLCGAHLSDAPVSTLGEQRRTNVYLQHTNLASYVMAVLDGLPDAPQYFKHNAKLNHDGPPLVDWEHVMPPALAPRDTAALAKDGAWLVDVRDAALFAAGHAKGAINIGIRGRFETWTGIVIPWAAPFVLAGSEDEVRESAARLKRIGYDAPAGFLKGGTDAWKQAGLPLGNIRMVSPADLFRQMQDGTAPVIVDVRLPNEWMAARIGQVLNIPLNKMFTEGKRLAPAMPALTVCNSAYRSSMGASMLLKMGFEDLRNLAGGGEAWIAAGLPTVGAAAGAQGSGPAAAAPLRSLPLPERLAASELKRMLLDLPGTFEVVDIRPAALFADYHLPGSRQADLATALNDPALLAGTVPLVLVDRDGSLAMAVAGALAQKTARPIKVLYGGLEAYWRESGPGGPAAPMPGPMPAPALTPPPSSPAPPAGPPPPQPPKKKSAGC